MANEITLSASLSYEDAEGTADALSMANVIKSVATKLEAHFKQNIGFASAEAINLAGITAPGYAMLINRDETNFIKVLTGTGGVIFATLDPDTAGNGTGGFALIKLGSGAQAPFAQADTADCQMEVLICSV